MRPRQGTCVGQSCLAAAEAEHLRGGWCQRNMSHKVRMADAASEQLTFTPVSSTLYTFLAIRVYTLCLFFTSY